MPSDRQIAANRINAKKSTGPRTSAGKHKVSRNAVRHGLLAQQVVLPNEDEAEFDAFRLGLERELQPVGELEEFFVSRIVASAWRLRRLQRVEKGIFIEYAYVRLEANARKSDLDARKPLRRQIETLADLDDEILAMSEGLRKRAEREAVPERDVPEANERAEEAEQRAAEAERLAERAGAYRDASDAILGAAFIHDGHGIDAFSKLSRYETQIERSMIKDIDQLRHLQSARGASSSGPGSLELDPRDGRKSD